MKRRDFLKYTVGGMAGLWVGSKLPPWVMNPAQAQPVAQSLNFSITSALKDMYTHQIFPAVPGFPALSTKGTVAQCFFWVFKEATLPADHPGPVVFVREGDAIPITVTNNLTQPHAFAIPGIGFNTTPIAPGDTFVGAINVPAGSAGTYLYLDDLNAPVNRVMGLHGAFVVMPNPANGTPFSAAVLAANPKIAQLFADLGVAAWWPGLAWDNSNIGGGPAPNGAGIPDTPAFRQYIWLLHQASPTLFADVGNTPGVFDAATFTDRFLNNSFDPADLPDLVSDAPQYFSISGESGHYCHDNPFLTPHLRVGEPCVMRCLNAGMWGSCMHIHANHFFMLHIRNEQTGAETFGGMLDLQTLGVPGVADNHIWLDVFGAHPMDVWEYVLPYMQPPDVPNNTGIGRADLQTPLFSGAPAVRGFGKAVVNGRERAANTPAAVNTWPPIQEVNFNIPKVGTSASLPRLVNGRIRFVKAPTHVPLSPLCYPMHDHSEPTQTTQGGNYNTGLISGMNFTGDRNANGRLPAPPAGSGITVGPDGKVFTFPMAPIAFEVARPADVPPQGSPDNATIVAVLGAEYVDQVHGANKDISPNPAGGPRPPFEETE